MNTFECFAFSLASMNGSPLSFHLFIVHSRFVSSFCENEKRKVSKDVRVFALALSSFYEKESDSDLKMSFRTRHEMGLTCKALYQKLANHNSSHHGHAVFILFIKFCLEFVSIVTFELELTSIVLWTCAHYQFSYIFASSFSCSKQWEFILNSLIEAQVRVWKIYSFHIQKKQISSWFEFH